jgi:hypothetical protein
MPEIKFGRKPARSAGQPGIGRICLLASDLPRTHVLTWLCGARFFPHQVLLLGSGERLLRSTLPVLGRFTNIYTNFSLFPQQQMWSAGAWLFLT